MTEIPQPYLLILFVDGLMFCAYKRFMVFVGFLFQEAVIPSAESLHILDFHFSDFGLTEEDLTTQATIRMFLDLNLVQEFNIDYKVTDLLI